MLILTDYCVGTDNKKDKFLVNNQEILLNFEIGVGKMTFIDGD